MRTPGVCADLERELGTIAANVRAYPASFAAHRANYHKLLMSRLRIRKYADVARVLQHMMGEPGMTPNASAFLDVLDNCASVRPAMLSAVARQRERAASELAARNGTSTEEELEAMLEAEGDSGAAWLACR